MLKIALCDDDVLFCTHMENILLDINKRTGIELEIEIFYTGEALFGALSKGLYFFDLIFMDIEMKMLSGVQVGQKIREEIHNDTVQIVYVSGKDSYAMSLFDIRPLNFLIKPVNAGKVESLVRKVFELTAKNKDFFEYKIGQVQRKVFLKDILYFESRGKKIRIILKNEALEFYGKLQDVENQVISPDFIPIHKSYFINYLYVIEYQYEHVDMANKISLPISQAYRKSVRDKLLERRKEETLCI